MMKSRTWIEFFAVSVIALASTVACKGGGAGSKAAGSATAVFPKDSAGVIGFSMKQFTDTELFKSFKPMIDKQMAANNDLKALCDMDPYTEMSSIIVAIPKDGNEKGFAMLIDGKADEAKATKCITAMAEKSGQKVEVKKTGNIVTFTEAGGSGESINASWLAGGGILITMGDPARMQELLDGKNTLKENKTIMDLMAKVDTSATLWGVGDVSAMGSMGHNMDLADEPPTAMYGTVKYGKTLEANIGFRFAGEASAKAAADKLNKEIKEGAANPMAGSYLKDVSVSASGNDAVVTAKLSEDQLKSLGELAKGLAPMLMGGGMGGGGF